MDLRLAALRSGVWLGWLSVAAVLAGLALDLPARHRAALLALTLAAGLANSAVVAVPKRWWTERHGERMLVLWSAGLVGWSATLVLVGGGRADLDLLTFLVRPFLATVHTGARRAAWLTLALAVYVAVMALAPDALPAGQVALRVLLLIAATLLALALAQLTSREAAARAELHARAELERTLLAEAHHRVKNSLQTVADLLLLARPDENGAAFDVTAERIRAIALVHRLLASERGADVDAAELLEQIAASLAPEATVRASAVRLEPDAAQQLGVVANELIANAVQHGRPPISVSLAREDELVLRVRDGGAGAGGAAPGLGLQLVERIVAQGLHGEFALASGGDGTEARVSFREPCGS
jgi:two-component sensor histidine kinase